MGAQARFPRLSRKTAGNLGRFDYLDQIRAIACLPVVFCHLNSALLPGGSVGVGLFFALSGYLIATICIREVHDLRSALAFVIRRIFRVYPLLLVDLAILSIAYVFFYEELRANFLRSLPELLLMAGMPNPFIGIGVGVLWTLQVEFAFYLLAPILCLIFGARRGLMCLAIFLLATSLLAAVCGIFDNSVLTSIGAVLEAIPILNWGGTLAFGVIVSLLWTNPRVDALRNNPKAIVAATSVSVVAVFLYAALFFFEPSRVSIWHWQLLAASALGASLIMAWLVHPRLFVIPGLPYIGRISFSIYLIHAVMADFAHFLNHSIGKSNLFSNPFVFVPVVILVSSLSYALIERPGMRLGAKIARRISPAEQAGVIAIRDGSKPNS